MSLRAQRAAPLLLMVCDTSGTGVANLVHISFHKKAFFTPHYHIFFYLLLVINPYNYMCKNAQIV
jgi:hypothetical protein